MNDADVNAATKAGNVTSLHRAAMMGHIDIVELLLRHKAHLEVQDSDGKNALHKVIPLYLIWSWQNTVFTNGKWRAQILKLARNEQK